MVKETVKECQYCEFYTDEKEFKARPGGREKILLQHRGICKNEKVTSYHHRVQNTSVKECFVVRKEKPNEEPKVAEQEKVEEQPKTEEKPIHKPGRKKSGKVVEEKKDTTTEEVTKIVKREGKVCIIK